MLNFREMSMFNYKKIAYLYFNHLNLLLYLTKIGVIIATFKLPSKGYLKNAFIMPD